VSAEHVRAEAAQTSECTECERWQGQGAGGVLAEASHSARPGEEINPAAGVRDDAGVEGEGVRGEDMDDEALAGEGQGFGADEVATGVLRGGGVGGGEEGDGGGQPIWVPQLAQNLAVPTF
jgi:hypothetical protein